MSDKRRRHFPVGDPRASAEQYHQDMFQRRQTHTISIRKQRKEDRLWRRRQPQTTSDRAVTVDELVNKLDSFLNSPHESAKLKDLQTTMSMNSTSTNQFLKYLIDNPELESKNRFLVNALSNLLQENTGTNGVDNVSVPSFAILMDLSSFSSIAPKPSADDYYGRAPLRWSDLIQENALLMDLFLARIRDPSSDGQILESVCIILGNLLQVSARPVPLILPAWSEIVQRLPVSTYLCATLVRQDSTHYGISFLHDLTPERLAKLLRESFTAVEASWILEALSRREKESIQTLCESLMLVSCIITIVEESMASSNASVLVPLLRAISNLVIGGRYAHTLVSQSSFLPAVSKLLDQGVVMESLEVAGALLTWNRCHNHTKIGIIPVLFPILVRIITSADTSFLWKRDAAWALCCSFYDEWSDDVVSPQVKEDVSTWLWGKLPVPPSDFVFAMTELLANPDAEAVLSAMRICDFLLRTVQPTLQLFENAGGVERLEIICEKGGEGALWDSAANLAAELLDDFFEGKDEEDWNIAPQRGENEFVFGISEPPKTSNFDARNAPGPGRGRGLTTPAWMQQHN